MIYVPDYSRQSLWVSIVFFLLYLIGYFFIIVIITFKGGEFSKHFKTKRQQKLISPTNDFTLFDTIILKDSGGSTK